MTDVLGFLHQKPVERYLTPQELAQLAREVLRKKGVTQMQAAEIVGVTQPTVAAALKGRSIDTASAIIKKIGGTSVSGPYFKVELQADFM